MLYTIENGDFHPVQTNHIDLRYQKYLGLFEIAEFEEVFQQFKISKLLIEDFHSSKTAKFESHDGFDLIYLNTLDNKHVRLQPQRIFIYLSQNALLLFCDNHEVLKILTDYVRTENEEITFDKTIYFLFKKLTVNEVAILEEIETEILELEDKLLSPAGDNCVRKIIVIRHKLMVLKGYYEQFYNILDGIQENENNIIDKNTLRFFKIFAGRLDRMMHQTLHLRDYITQVREAYQAQEDIRLNEIMKLFTVITAIVSPLTLIVGWYGMNLKMPEYGLNFAYPLVIVLCVAVVGVCILYFKKHKWF